MLRLYTNDLKKDDYAWITGAFSTAQLFNFLTQEQSLVKAFYQSAIEVFFERDDEEARLYQEKLIKEYLQNDFDFDNDVAADVTQILVRLVTKPNIPASLKIQAMLLFVKISDNMKNSDQLEAIAPIMSLIKNPLNSSEDLPGYLEALRVFRIMMPQAGLDALMKSVLHWVRELSASPTLNSDSIACLCAVIDTLIPDCSPAFHREILLDMLDLIILPCPDTLVHKVAQTTSLLTYYCPDMRSETLKELKSLVASDPHSYFHAAYIAIAQITPPEDMKEREELLLSLMTMASTTLKNPKQNNAVCMTIAKFSRHCPRLKNEAYQELININFYKTVEELDNAGTQMAMTKMCTYFPEFIYPDHANLISAASPITPPVAPKIENSRIQLLVAQFTEQALAKMLPTNQMSKRVDNCI